MALASLLPLVGPLDDAAGVRSHPRPEAGLTGPAWYRPVVVDGRTFPVARSNYLSLLTFGDSWHEPRMRVVDGKWRLVGLHEGIDIAAEPGTPVVSMTPGVVERTGWLFYSGLRVGVRGTDGRYYLYAHLDAIAHGISPGARVAAGDLLGTVGNTGYGPPGHRDEFAPHLHFGIEGDSGWANPYPELVGLYETAARRNARDQRNLDALAARGRVREWHELAPRVLTTFEL